MKDYMPEIYNKLNDIQHQLEKHYKDMQDIEFTIQSGRLWMLQTRTGKRNGFASVRIAIEMLEEKLIDEKLALLRVKPEQLDEIMHPMLDAEAEKKSNCLLKDCLQVQGGLQVKLFLQPMKQRRGIKRGNK